MPSLLGVVQLGVCAYRAGPLGSMCTIAKVLDGRQCRVVTSTLVMLPTACLMPCSLAPFGGYDPAWGDWLTWW